MENTRASNLKILAWHQGTLPLVQRFSQAQKDTQIEGDGVNKWNMVKILHQHQ
jgi:hypothetical protein